MALPPYTATQNVRVDDAGRFYPPIQTGVVTSGGGGTSLVQSSGVIKEIVAGTGITVVSGPTTVTISSTAISSGGGGTQLTTASGTVKTLVAGANITLTPAADSITIAAPAPSSQINDLQVRNSLGENPPSFNTADASGTPSISLGSASLAFGANSIAVGTNCFATGVSSITIGTNNATSPGQDSIAMGVNARSQVADTTAIGHDSFANAANAVAIGHSANALGENNVAIGPNAIAGIGTGTIQLGAGDSQSLTNHLQFRAHTIHNGLGATYGAMMVKRGGAVGNYVPVETFTDGFDPRNYAPEPADSGCHNLQVYPVGYNRFDGQTGPPYTFDPTPSVIVGRVPNQESVVFTDTRDAAAGEPAIHFPNRPFMFGAIFRQGVTLAQGRYPGEPLLPANDALGAHEHTFFGHGWLRDNEPTYFFLCKVPERNWIHYNATVTMMRIGTTSDDGLQYSVNSFNKPGGGPAVETSKTGGRSWTLTGAAFQRVAHGAPRFATIDKYGGGEDSESPSLVDITGFIPLVGQFTGPLIHNFLENTTQTLPDFNSRLTQPITAIKGDPTFKGFTQLSAKMGDFGDYELRGAAFATVAPDSYPRWFGIGVKGKVNHLVDVRIVLKAVIVPFME